MESIESGTVLESQATTDAPRAAVRLRTPQGLVSLLKWLSTPLHLFMALLALIPPIVVLGFVVVYGANMPYWDEWDNGAIIAIKTMDGTLTFADLARQNYDHRLFFSNSLTALMTIFAHWNLKLEMLVSIALTVGSLILLIATLRKYQANAVVVALVPFSALIFTLRHNSNWLWGQQSSWFFTIFFTVAALWVLHTRPQSLRTILIAGVLAFGATFSTLHGLSTWLAIGALMLMSGYRNPRHYALLVGMALLAVFLYSTNYDFGSLGADQDGNAAGLVRNPVNIILYVIAYLGNPFVITIDSAALLSSVLGVLGLVLFCVNLWVIWRLDRSLRVVAPWVSLVLWVGSVAFLTALGRAHVYPALIPRQPLLDRYALPATLLWIALIALIVYVAGRDSKINFKTLAGKVTSVNFALLIALVPLYFYASYDGLERGALLESVRVECMLRFQATRNTSCMARTYLKQTPLINLIDRVNNLARYQLTAFAGRDPIYTENIPLYRTDRVVTRGENSGFRFYEPAQDRQYFAFQQPAPGQADFLVDIPETERNVFVGGGVVADTSAGTNGLENAIVFRVGVIREGSEGQVLGEVIFDPTVDSGPKPYRFSLNDYRGESIRLVLQTSSRDGGPVDEPVWVDPLVFVDPDD